MRVIITGIHNNLKMRKDKFHHTVIQALRVLGDELDSEIVLDITEDYGVHGIQAIQLAHRLEKQVVIPPNQSAVLNYGTHLIAFYNGIDKTTETMIRKAEAQYGSSKVHIVKY